MENMPPMKMRQRHCCTYQQDRGYKQMIGHDCMCLHGIHGHTYTLIYLCVCVWSVSFERKRERKCSVSFSAAYSWSSITIIITTTIMILLLLFILLLLICILLIIIIIINFMLLSIISFISTSSSCLISSWTSSSFVSCSFVSTCFWLPAGQIWHVVSPVPAKVPAAHGSHTIVLETLQRTWMDPWGHWPGM